MADRILFDGAVAVAVNGARLSINYGLVQTVQRELYSMEGRETGFTPEQFRSLSWQLQELEPGSYHANGVKVVEEGQEFSPPEWPHVVLRDTRSRGRDDSYGVKVILSLAKDEKPQSS